MTEPTESVIDSGTTEPDPGATAGKRSITRGSAWRQLYNYLLLVALLVVIAFFSLLRPRIFPTVDNLASILTSGAPLMLIALAAMVPLIVNQFDLTPGYVATLGALLTAGLLVVVKLDPILAVLVSIGACLAVGFINGILVAYARLNSLIVTLGAGSMIFGFAQLYSNGQTIFGVSRSFTAIGQTRLLGILPVPFVLAFIVAVIIWYLLEYRPVGRRLYAIGGSEEGARLLGINVARLTFAVFIASALLAGLAGIIETSRVGSANPTGQQAQLLPAFTAAFLGATSIRPGQYNVWGTVLAVYLVKASTTGMFMLGLPAFTSDVFNGAILLIAIGLAKISSRRLADVR